MWVLESPWKIPPRYALKLEITLWTMGGMHPRPRCRTPSARAREGTRGLRICRFSLPHASSTLVMAELAPGVPRAVLGATDDTQSLIRSCPDDGCGHRLLLRAAPARAMGLHPDTEVVDTTTVSAARTLNALRSCHRTAYPREHPVRRSCSCSLSGAGGHMHLSPPPGSTWAISP